MARRIMRIVDVTDDGSEQVVINAEMRPGVTVNGTDKFGVYGNFVGGDGVQYTMNAVQYVSGSKALRTSKELAELKLSKLRKDRIVAEKSLHDETERYRALKLDVGTSPLFPALSEALNRARIAEQEQRKVVDSTK